MHVIDMAVFTVFCIAGLAFLDPLFLFNTLQNVSDDVEENVMVMAVWLPLWIKANYL